MNGYEIGGGSIRNHKPEALLAVYEIMGVSKEQAEKNLFYMLEAFRSGTPPHGGIAHGIERNLMTFFGEDYLREVQAFPQTSSGSTSVMEAPDAVSAKQLKELHLKPEK